MFLEYKIYYKKFGIRRISQLLSPPVFSWEFFSLPRNSAWHLLSHDEDNNMPDGESSLFKGYNKKIIVDHIRQMTSELGNPKLKPVIPKTVYGPWQIKNNRKFRYVANPELQAIDQLSLVVYNYGVLHSLYRYPPMPMTEYFRWRNLEKTRWDTVNNASKVDKKNHFILVELPTILPAFSALQIYQNKQTPQLLKVFDTPERLFILELWKWLNSDMRANSSMADIEPDNFPYINLIFKYHDRFTVINLGKLESWRMDSEAETAEIGQPRLKTLQLQKLMLKLFMSVQSQGISDQDIAQNFIEPLESDEDEGGGLEKPESDFLEDDSDDGVSQDSQEEDDYLAANIINKQTRIANKTPALTQATDVEIETTLTSKLTDLDDDIEMLERMNSSIYSVKNDTIEEEEVIDFEATPEELGAIESSIFNVADPYEQLKSDLDRQAETGVLPSANYRTLLKQLQATENLKSPKDPSKSLKDYIQISHDELTVKEEDIAIPPTTGVLDQSMLKSSLNVFDKQYVSSVLPKDIAANVHHLVRAGILVKDYQVEEESSAMGIYETHRLSIKPIDGAESTIYFRIPKVNSEGEFLVSGNRYRMRKQRSDVPIRKISPMSVALTSYYGKVFVNRSERKQFDRYSWLTDEIMKIGLAGGNDAIKKIAPAMVYDNTFKSPRIYSSIAMRFKYIYTSQYTLAFDHTERSEILNSDKLANIEGDKYVLCGKTKKDEYILVDYDDNFYVYRDNTYVFIGTVFSLLNISPEKAPIEFSELKIFSKSIPLAVVMGYYIGLTKLIKLLGIKPKVLDAGTRYVVQDDEFIVRFKNKKLVFSLKDRKASLIMAGLLFFKDTTKLYDYSHFDSPSIYLNLLDQRNLNSRYLKELDNLKQLFIDPITESILEEMKEPKTFQGLLLRANELLMTDYHPDTNDLNFMRIKGYERIAGMAYRELMNSVREYKSRNIRGKSQVSISPYAIWSAITKDQTVKLSEDINPINDLKEVEAVTYVGSDGRAKEAMTKTAREFHKTDMGVISEATVDSGDVGINSYLSANPKLVNVRGLSGGYNSKEDGLTALFSTSAILAPFITNDD